MEMTPLMEQILDLSLEIVSVVTGQRCAVVTMASIEALLRGLYPHKSGDRRQSSAMMPPTPDKPDQEKILAATNKITELLMGEVSVSVQAVIKLEEEEEEDDVVELGYLEGPKDLYKSPILSYHLAGTSSGGLSTGCPTGEGFQTPRHNDVCSLERSPLHFPDATLQEQNLSHHYQGEDVSSMTVKGEEAEEDLYVRDDQRSSVNEEVMVKIKQEEITAGFESGQEHDPLHPQCQIGDADFLPYSTLEGSDTPEIHRYPGPTHFQGASLSRSKPATPGTRNDETFSCPECQKCFTSKSAMYGHQKVHAVDRSFICSECGKTFKNNVCLRIHQYSHSGKFPFSCPECGKGFPHQSNLLAHIRSHTGERPYSCPECGKRFMKRSRLVIHQRYHTGEKPYSCSECGKGFADASVFKKHQKLHTTVKPYRCLECGKSVILKSDLETHQRRHTGELQYLCSECGKCFVTKSELLRHQVVHTGLKPYSCSQCSKRFFSRSHLVRHEKGHVKEKPCLCFICGRGFSDQIQLTKHQRSHTAERLYSCHHCEKTFLNKSSLVRHQLIHGGDHVPPDTPQILSYTTEGDF